MRSKKITALFTSVIIIISVFFTNALSFAAGAAFTPDIDLYSTGYYMVNLDLGTVIAKKNENERCYPASITKLMTAIVCMENCSNLDRLVEIGYDATDEFWTHGPNYEGAGHSGAKVGQSNFTMRDALYSLLIKSACDSGNIIAVNIAGSIEAYTDMMNKKAAEIGCKGTHFCNTHGLWDENNYSTPYDLYLIARYAYDHLPELIEISNMYDYAMPANSDYPSGYSVYNVNSLINNVSENPYYYEYASGIKTGSMNEYYTKDSEGNWTVKHEGFANIVSTAMQKGFHYMLVTVGAPYHDAEGNKLNGHFKDSIAMYKWAFRTFGIVEVMNENTVISHVKVDMGENSDVVILKPASSFSTLLPTDLDPKIIRQEINVTAETNDNGAVVAPIEKGEVLGSLELFLDGEVIWTTNLIASQAIELSQFEYTMRMINSIFDKSWFKLCVVALIVLIVADVILNGIQKSRIAKMEARQKRRANLNSRKW